MRRTHCQNERRVGIDKFRDKEQAGCRKRGKPQLRWEDCLKRDIIEAEGKEKWRGARDKHNESSHRAERQLASHTPQGKREEEQ